MTPARVRVEVHPGAHKPTGAGHRTIYNAPVRVLGHSQKEIEGTHNLHAYEEERRE